MKQLNVQLLLTGNELMSGDIVDSNSAMIAQHLKPLGLEISRKVTLGDDQDKLAAEINYLSAQADILIINGGLGPTIDDMTAQALAQATKVVLAQHPQALTHLKTWSANRGSDLNQPTLKQALLPQGCAIIDNNCGSAVGFMVNHQSCAIYCTPGVPSELKSMLELQIVPILSQQVPKALQTHVTRLQLFGIGESSLQKLIDQAMPDWPDDIQLGFRADNPFVEIKLTSRNLGARQRKLDCIAKLTELFGAHIITEIEKEPVALAESLLTLLANKKLKLTTAESCTGGLIASMLTQIAGSSEVFEAGYVTYSNQMKTQMLDVAPQLLIDYGAVSEQTVRAMAQGALAKSKADLAIAVSGIAGPGGATMDKAVGTVCIAWGSRQRMQSQCLVVPGSRVNFQQYVAALSLDLIRRLVLNSEQIPHYITLRNCANGTANASQ
jgi:nicotinamide-nucleotide amidase